ncbi:MAG TPA: hypothetical protein DD381_13795 [Lentisphaeria bacterium]|nr:hypothetical protein [Lentisphaeria bacterium]
MNSFCVNIFRKSFRFKYTIIACIMIIIKHKKAVSFNKIALLFSVLCSVAMLVFTNIACLPPEMAKVQTSSGITGLILAVIISGLW